MWFCVVLFSLLHFAAAMEINVHLSLTVPGSTDPVHPPIVKVKVTPEDTVRSIFAKVWEHRHAIALEFVNVPKGQMLDKVIATGHFVVKFDPTEKVEIDAQKKVKQLAAGFKKYGNQLYVSMGWRFTFIAIGSSMHIGSGGDEFDLGLNARDAHADDYYRYDYDDADYDDADYDDADYDDAYGEYGEYGEYNEYDGLRLLRELRKEQQVLALQKRLNRIARRQNNYYA